MLAVSDIVSDSILCSLKAKVSIKATDETKDFQSQIQFFNKKMKQLLDKMETTSKLVEEVKITFLSAATKPLLKPNYIEKVTEQFNMLEQGEAELDEARRLYIQINTKFKNANGKAVKDILLKVKFLIKKAEDNVSKIKETLKKMAENKYPAKLDEAENSFLGDCFSLLEKEFKKFKNLKTGWGVKDYIVVDKVLEGKRKNNLIFTRYISIKKVPTISKETVTLYLAISTYLDKPRSTSKGELVGEFSPLVISLLPREVRPSKIVSQSLIQTKKQFLDTMEYLCYENSISLFTSNLSSIVKERFKALKETGQTSEEVKKDISQNIEEIKVNHESKVKEVLKTLEDKKESFLKERVSQKKALEKKVPAAEKAKNKVLESTMPLLTELEKLTPIVNKLDGALAHKGLTRADLPPDKLKIVNRFNDLTKKYSEKKDKVHQTIQKFNSLTENINSLSNDEAVHTMFERQKQEELDKLDKQLQRKLNVADTSNRTPMKILTNPKVKIKTSGNTVTVRVPFGLPQRVEEKLTKKLTAIDKVIDQLEKEQKDVMSAFEKFRKDSWDELKNRLKSSEDIKKAKKEFSDSYEEELEDFRVSHERRYASALTRKRNERLELKREVATLGKDAVDPKWEEDLYVEVKKLNNLPLGGGTGRNDTIDRLKLTRKSEVKDKGEEYYDYLFTILPPPPQRLDTKQAGLEPIDIGTTDEEIEKMARNISI